MKHMIIKEEGASYTIEACISLVAFLIAIIFIYTQIKVMVCENIMQHAVDGMASEMSTYVYVLDRAGLIIEHKKDELKGTDDTISAISDVGSKVQQNLSDFTDIYQSLEGGDISGAVTQFGSMKGNASSVVDSVKNVAKLVKEVNWKEQGTTALRNLGENAAESAANTLLSEFYNWKLQSYLPSDREKFCQKYMIDESSINFNYSRILPGDSNNCIVVAVTYETSSPFKMFPLKRKITKVAYIAAWVDGNTHKLK